MRKIFAIVFSLLMTTSSVVLGQPDPNFHVYIAFGQSNMEGQGKLEQQDLLDISPRLLTLSATDYSWRNRSKGEWYPAVPPLCREDLVTVDPTTRGLGPCDYFGRTMVANTPDSIRIGIICVAVGASAIEGFMKDKSLTQNFYNNVCWDWLREKFWMYDYYAYQHIVNLARRAQSDGVIKGILIHQGESNFGQSDWPTKVRGIYRSMLSDLGLRSSDVPLVVGEVVEKGPSVAMNDIIRTIPSVIPTGHVVSSSGIPEQPGDEIHFSPEGYREIGRRYAHEFLTLEGYTTTDSDGTWHESLSPELERCKSALLHSTATESLRVALSSAISDAESGKSSKSALTSALHTYISSGAQPEHGYPFDMTYLAGSTPDSWEGYTAPYYYLRGGLCPEFYAWDINKQGIIMRQTLTGIPNGNYSVILEAASSFTSGRGFTSPITTEGGDDRSYVYANEISEMVPVIDMGNNLVYDATTYVLHDVLVSDGKLEFGLRRDRKGSNWDVLRLKKIVMSSAGDNSVLIDELRSVESTASLYSHSSTLPAAIVSRLTQRYSDDENISVEDCKARIKELEEVIRGSSSASHSYKAFLQAKSEVESILNESHYIEKVEGAHQAFENSISETATNASQSTNSSDIDIQTAALRQVLYTYISDASPSEGHVFDLTFMLTNPDLTPFLAWQKIDGWYCDQTSGNSNTMSNNSVISSDGLVCFYEYWNPSAPTSGFTAYTKITLPIGNYRSTALAFAREASSTPHISFSTSDEEGPSVTSEVLSPTSIEFTQSSENEVKIGLLSHSDNTATWMGIGYLHLYKLPETSTSIESSINSNSDSPYKGVFNLQGQYIGECENMVELQSLSKGQGQSVSIWNGQKFLTR